MNNDGFNAHEFAVTIDRTLDEMREMRQSGLPPKMTTEQKSELLTQIEEVKQQARDLLKWLGDKKRLDQAA